jgi:hypothetical protein
MAAIETLSPGTFTGSFAPCRQQKVPPDGEEHKG